jgi:hypothetical protein
MAEHLIELLSEILGMLLYALGTSILAILGTVVEKSGIQYITAGDTILGIWCIGIGIIVLCSGYLLATDKLFPQIRVLARRRFASI